MYLTALIVLLPMCPLLSGRFEQNIEEAGESGLNERPFVGRL